MRKKIYMLSCVGLAVALSTGIVGCSKKTSNDIETSGESVASSSNYTPYIQETPAADAPTLEDRPHWETKENLEDIIASEAAAEPVPESDGEIGNKRVDKETTPVETVADKDTGETIEKKTSLDGGGAISIAKTEVYTEVNPMEGRDTTGEVVYLDDYDSIDIKPSAKEAGATYEIQDNKLVVTVPDEGTVEFVKIGNGFVAASVLNMTQFKNAAVSKFNFDATGSALTRYNMDDNGPRVVAELLSSDMTESICMFRGNNGTYAAHYVGTLPYRCQGLESMVSFSVIN